MIYAATLNFDQSSVVRCPRHGRRAGMFVRPEPNSFFPAFYTCLHCAKELVGNREQITHAERDSLPRLK